MSAEVQVYVLPEFRAKKETPKKMVANYPKNWGSSTNKRISTTAVWRK